ncbi:hypothetical protein [Amycolatopsis samaneae]|uniref:Uncharacterized protein n=1 Tax=Amycolatopsis samaneae TaxID=664691 RepID=A0ABW5GCR3_9PSEU
MSRAIGSTARRTVDPWDDAPIADLGALTLPQFRGRATRDASHAPSHATAIGRDHEPQLDNHASEALADSVGLTRFGTWDVLASDS